MLLVVTDRADCVKGFETVISSNHVSGNWRITFGEAKPRSPTFVREGQEGGGREGGNIENTDSLVDLYSGASAE